MSERAPDPEAPRAVVVVPIRSFHDPKQRLASVLDPDGRRRLARDLAGRVLRACTGRAVAVVSDDPDVIALAVEHGAAVLADPGSLDAAARAGVTWARELGADRVVVLHADLPFVRDLSVLVDPGRAPVAVLVPDQRHDGTPALSIPATSDFGFAYGPGSFARHRAAADVAGLLLRVEHDAALGFDVDLPEDLAAMTAREEPR
jgi:2-phospho-L-lactate guanylyltransferase